VANTDRQDNPPKVTRERPVLTADQVVELALSPELFLFP